MSEYKIGYVSDFELFVLKDDPVMKIITNKKTFKIDNFINRLDCFRIDKKFTNGIKNIKKLNRFILQ
jgi:hypothetical protein